MLANRLSALAVIALAATAIPTALHAEEPAPKSHKYAVMPFSVARGIDDAATKLLDELLLTELSKQAPEGSSFMGESDIVAIIGLEQQKAMLACDDDSCMAELGNALGVDYLVTPALGKLGEEYVVNIKVIDPKQVKVIKRETISVPGVEGALRGAVKQTAAVILGKQGDTTLAVANKADASPDQTTEDDAGGMSALGWIGIGTAALGVVVLAAGGVGVGVADSTLGNADSLGQEKQDARAIYGAGLAGLGLGAVVAGVGAALAVIGG